MRIPREALTSTTGAQGTTRRREFDWIETWYNPKRRHSYNNAYSPIDYETANAA